jgi:hypothetical protein
MLSQETSEDIFKVIYYSLIFVGIILSLIALSINSNSNAYISIYAYIFISIGVIFIIGLLTYKFTTQAKRGLWDFISFLFFNIGPFCLLIGILAFTLYLLFAFKDKIISGNLVSSYGLFSKLSVLFILMQLYVTYYGMQKQSFKESGILQKKYSSLSYLIGVINVCMVLILTSILKYFSTDG